MSGNPTDPAYIVQMEFNDGWKTYNDLATLIGEHRAKIALGHCFDICVPDPKEVARKSMSISNSTYINPENRQGVDLLIELLSLQVLEAMRVNKCFITTHNGLHYELFDIKPGKLIIQPRYGSRTLHPFLKGEMRDDVKKKMNEQ